MASRSRDYRGYLLASLSTLVGLALPLLATQARADALETVVVTAERRSEDIQKTPIAVTVVSADQLRKSNVNTISDLNGMVPGLNVTPSAGFETVVTIRGVGLETPENALTTSPGVALFIDGAYVANSVALDQTLFDLSHIEVLRGPQGALYGQSATGGAILLVTNQPDPSAFSGKVDFELGNYDLHKETGELNIPVTDDLAVRISGQQYAHDGFTVNNYPPGSHLDDADDWSAKFATLWQPTDDFKATLSTEFYHAYQNAAAQKNINDPNASPWVVTQDFVPRFDMATNLTHLNIEWDLPWFAVKSITTYQWLDNVQGEDSSRSAFSLIHAYDDVAAWDTSLQNYNQELDIQSTEPGPFQWTVGGFGMAQRSHQFVAEFECSAPCATPPTTASLTVPPDIETVFPPNLGYGNDGVTNRKSWAIFAQASYQILDDLKLEVGGRMNADTYHQISYTFFSFSPESPTIPPPPGPPFYCTPPVNGTYQKGDPCIADHKSSDHVPTWHAVLDWQATPDNLLYVSANRGYKPSGVNGIYGQSTVCSNPFNPASCNPNEPLLIPNVFKPETNTSFEIGAKNSFLDGALILNVDGFYYFYDNMQYIATDPVPFDGGIANIPSTHIWGGEAEAWYEGMDDHLHLHGILSLEGGAIQGNFKTLDSTTAQHIEATDPNCTGIPGAPFFWPACWDAVIAGARDVGGNSPAKMPNVVFSGDAAYDFRMFNGVVTPRVQVIFHGGYWARIFAEPALDKVPSYTLVNLHVQYVPDNSNLIFAITATNIGNEAGVLSRYTDPYGTGQTSQQFVPPSQVIGSVSWAF